MITTPLDPPPLAVLFDLDDTLCDYSSARNARLRAAFTLLPNGESRNRQGLDLDAMIADSIRRHPHGADHFRDLFATYGITDPAEADAAATWYRTHRFHGLDFFPEARDVLQTVKTTLAARKGVAARPIGIVTNGPTEVQREKLKLLGIADLVDFAIISEEFGAAKPDPEIFREALRQAEVDAQQAIFVGDAVEFDMAGAQAAGIPSVWLNRSEIVWPEPDWRPTREIRSLDELPRLIGPPGLSRSGEMPLDKNSTHRYLPHADGE